MIYTFNRYEKKYLIDLPTQKRICEQFAKFMRPDRNGDNYLIENLYYDTFDNHYIRKSLAHPRYKEKIRLRTYGETTLDSDAFIEIKKKFNGIVNKRRVRMPLRDAYEFLENPNPEMQIEREIAQILARYKIEPMVYISYYRTAFHAVDDANLRISFDSNVLSRRVDLRLENGSYGEFIIPTKMRIMEIKTLNAIPLWLVKILTEMRLYPQGFSKYGREFEKLCWNQSLMGQEQKQSLLLA